MGIQARTWWIVAGLALGPAISNGFARFAYGLLLPSMRSDLDWTFTQAGWINTANAIGYLIGAVLALSIISRTGAKPLFIGGLALTAGALVASGLTRDFTVLSFWRTMAGIGGAPVFIAGGVIASSLFADDKPRNALAIAVYFGGGGLGMLICGIALPDMIARGGHIVWPSAWVLIGIASGIASVPAIWSALKAPPDVKAEKKGTAPPLPIWRMSPALAAYFMFGLGYTIYITFLIAWMRAGGAKWSEVSFTWAVMGAMVMVSPFLWRGVLARAEGGGAIAATLLASATGVAIALLVGGTWGVVTSAALFGASFFMVPTSTTTFGRKNLREAQWGASLSLFTVLFSLGQIIGPVGAGALADLVGGVEEGLIASALILAIGAAIGMMQRPLRK
ncbi:MAG: YbfB/YjiJ family MFS transporter [Pikeienuella sp.]